MPKDFPKKINTTEAATKILFHVLDQRHNGGLALVKTQDKNTRAMPTGEYWVFPNTDPCGTSHGVAVFFLGGGGEIFRSNLCRLCLVSQIRREPIIYYSTKSMLVYFVK